MQPDRTGSRTTVERERHRPVAGLGKGPAALAILDEAFIGDEEDPSLHLAVGLLEERQRAGGGAISNRLTVLDDLVLGDAVGLGMKHRIDPIIDARRGDGRILDLVVRERDRTKARREDGHD